MARQGRRARSPWGLEESESSHVTRLEPRSGIREEEGRISSPGPAQPRQGRKGKPRGWRTLRRMIALYSRHTHVALADESSHNIGRYRSLGLVTCAREDVDVPSAEAAQLPASSSVHELKWSLLNSARDRHAAEKVITWAVDCAAGRRLAIDALVWDTHDARHAVMRRDDVPTCTACTTGSSARL